MIYEQACPHPSEGLRHDLSVGSLVVSLLIPVDERESGPAVMPTSKHCGTPGEANELIGGVPIVHYLDFASRGRGQVVRLLFEDAGIAYEDVRYSDEELPEAKRTILQEMNPASTMPILELQGKAWTQSYALLRHFSRVLGKYDGRTEEEKYWVDAMCDLAADCKRRPLTLLHPRPPTCADRSPGRNVFVFALFNPDKQVYAKHKADDRVRYMYALETQLKKNEFFGQGPFVLGKTFTYADMVIYQVCHDEQLIRDGRRELRPFPRLTRLVDALESRPNVRAFRNSDRYKGDGIPVDMVDGVQDGPTSSV